MSVATQPLQSGPDRCPHCGSRLDSEDRQNAEIALAHIMAIQRRPGALAQFEQMLRHLGGLKSGVVRTIVREEEDAALRR